MKFACVARHFDISRAIHARDSGPWGLNFFLTSAGNWGKTPAVASRRLFYGMIYRVVRWLTTRQGCSPVNCCEEWGLNNLRGQAVNMLKFSGVRQKKFKKRRALHFFRPLFSPPPAFFASARLRSPSLAFACLRSPSLAFARLRPLL